MSSANTTASASSAVLRGRLRGDEDDDNVGGGGAGGFEERGDVVSTTRSANSKRPKTTTTLTTTTTRTDDDEDDTVVGDDLSAMMMVLAKLLGLSSSSSSQEEEEDQQSPPHSSSSVGTFTKDDVKELVEEAIIMKEDDDDDESSSKKNEQATIYDAGLLSLQQVLLPLVAIQHERGLRSFQGLLKRDAQDWREEQQQSHDDGLLAMDELYQCAINIVQHCRATALEAVGAAVEAARESEQRRVQQYQQRLSEQHQQQVAKRRAQRQLQAEIHKIGRPKRLREARKRHPPNVELYREQAMLLSQLAQLDTEFENWESVERQVKAEAAKVAAMTMTTEVAEEDNDDDNTNTTNNPRAFVYELLDEVERAQVSVDRIQSATCMVDDMITKAEQTRAQLYTYYTESVRYQQYQVPIRRPKALLKELSQQSNSVATSSTTTTLSQQQDEHADKSPMAAMLAPLNATTNLVQSTAPPPK